MKTQFFDVLGLTIEESGQGELVEELMNLIIDIRKTAKENKNYALSDKIRVELGKVSIEIRDSKDGVEWNLK